MKEIMIEASSNGVGIKSYPSGHSIGLDSLQISESLLRRIEVWIKNYELANIDESIQYQTIDKLEKEGVNIALSLSQEMPEFNLIYQSDLLLLAM